MKKSTNLRIGVRFNIKYKILKIKILIFNLKNTFVLLIPSLFFQLVRLFDQQVHGDLRFEVYQG